MYEEVTELSLMAQANGLQEEPKVVEAPKEVPEKETDREKNFRVLRERSEQAERRAAEMERQIQALQQAQKAAPQEDDEMHFDDEGYVEGKQLKKYVKTLKTEMKQMRQQLQESQQQTHQSSAEMRLKSRYSDFDSVVTPDNIQKLATLKPSLYRSLMSNTDLYDKGETAYDSIKAFVATERYEAEDRRLEENAKKPRSSAVAPSQSADSPLARVGDYDRRILTEERKEQLRQQVAQAKMYR